MTIKVICDMCGNYTGNKFVRASITVNGVDWNRQNHIHSANVGTQQAQAANALQQYPIATEYEYVELCHHCNGVWLERVKSITERSNPEGAK